MKKQELREIYKLKRKGLTEVQVQKFQENIYQQIYNLDISEVKNVLESEDIFSCINCLRKLGVKIKRVKAKHYLIYGKGLGSFYAKKKYCFRLWKLWYHCEAAYRFAFN